jgi:hypothetical protein
VLDLGDAAADLAGLTARVGQLFEELEGSCPGGRRPGRGGGGGGGGGGRGGCGAAAAAAVTVGGEADAVVLRWWRLDEGRAPADGACGPGGAGRPSGAETADGGGAGGGEALAPLPPWAGASEGRERYAAEALLLRAPRRYRLPPPPGAAPGDSGGGGGGGALAAGGEPPPAAGPWGGGGELEVSLHSLGAGELRRRAAEVFPGAPRGAALLAAVTFQFLRDEGGGGGGGGGGGNSSGGGGGGGGEDGCGDGGYETAGMRRALDAFLRWEAAVRGRLEAG